MLPRRSRHVQILPLLCAVCHLALAFPTQTPSPYDEVRQLQVNIPHSGPIFAPLGSSVSLPCLVSLSTAPASTSSAPIAPRVKWTVVSGGVETQILVARGQRVKVNEAYRDRASLLNYTSTPDDLSLWLGDLRPSDSAHYRCEVQQGLEDASDLVQLKVKGVVFHYRDALGRYAFSFPQAQRACEAIGARIATADQLLAAYYDGYEQCDAGWLADQSVRYPIQVPREGCYGDMDGQPGVRNYGTMNPDDLYDVYCYVEQIDGEVFHDGIPQHFSFDEAQSYCRAAGAELATTAQLYWAWSEGLDCCSPGWLSDGSVRYPIVTPRERCGGHQAGVKTIYRFSNQTGFPEPNSLHDVYCFRESRNPSTDSPMNHLTTEAEDIGHDIVILVENDQELHLQPAEQVEREAQSVLESLPFISSFFRKESLTTASTNPTAPPVSTTSTQEPNQTFAETPSPTEASDDSQLVMNSTVSSAETFDSPQNATHLPEVSNETDSHQELNSTFHPFDLEGTANESETHNGTETEAYTEEGIEPSEMSREIQNGDFNSSSSNHTQTGRNQTQEESLWDVTPMTLEPQVKLDEAATEDPMQVSPTTEASNEEGALLNETVQTTKVPVEGPTSLWAHVDGSGDSSQELDMESLSFSLTSDSPAANSTTSAPPSTPPSATPTEPRTVPSDPSIDKLGSDVLSTTSQLWESSVSRQEGSTSLENEDTLHMENEQKSDDRLVSGESLATTESPESWNTSQTSTTESTTAQYRTSEYRVGLNTMTSFYEEASGHEADVVGEDGTVTPTSEEEVTVSPPLEGETNNSSSLEREVGATTMSVSLEEMNTSSVPENQTDVTPTLDFEEGVNAAPTRVFGQETNVAPTTVFEEEANVSSAFEKQEEALGTLKEDGSVTPTIAEDGNVTETNDLDPVDEIRITPTLDDVTLTPDIEDEAEVTPTLVLEEESGLEDFTVASVDSQTSEWALVTTTTGPQESLNGLEYSHKTFTAASGSSVSTKPTTASAKTTAASVKTTTTAAATTTTTRHWSRRTWSPATTTPEVPRETAATHVMPPVDHALVDLEISLTQPPTLLILPNERAAVGGAGKSSDACESDPCLNGGTCTEREGDIKCLCLPTYGGDLCQTDLERCEPGWDKFHGFCYRHFGQRQSWEVAEQHCRLLGAHLVSIMTPEEQSFINDNYKEYQWTGLNDKTIEDDFRWSDGNPLLYENWYHSQPDSYFLSGEDCVVMVWHDDGRWSDVPCNYHLAYTCKRGTSSCGPPPRVRNASIFGKLRPRYETNAVVRYRCAGGFQQRMNPVVRCLSGGIWERPLIRCFPEAGGPTQRPGVTSPTDNNFAAADFDEFEASKETPQYRDIKF